MFARTSGIRVGTPHAYWGTFQAPATGRQVLLGKSFSDDFQEAAQMSSRYWSLIRTYKDVGSSFLGNMGDQRTVLCFIERRPRVALIGYPQFREEIRSFLHG
jgi:hypothetical protein